MIELHVEMAMKFQAGLLRHDNVGVKSHHGINLLACSQRHREKPAPEMAVEK